MAYDLDREPNNSEQYVPQAAYFLDSDCVEYVKEDTLNIYERVDDFLTLIWDETKLTLVGFKLKGFQYVFNAHLKPLYKLNDGQFINLVSAIEAYFTEVGNDIFDRGDQHRAAAYKAALKLAANDNVRLSGAMSDDRTLPMTAHTKSAPAAHSSLPSGESDPSVMPDSTGADTDKARTSPETATSEDLK